MAKVLIVIVVLVGAALCFGELIFRMFKPRNPS
jgi:hypothetical protein